MKKIRTSIAAILAAAFISSAVSVSAEDPYFPDFEPFEETGRFGMYDDSDPYKLILINKNNKGGYRNTYKNYHYSSYGSEPEEFREWNDKHIHFESLTDETWWGYDDRPYCTIYLDLPNERWTQNTVVRIPSVIETPDDPRFKSRTVVGIDGSLDVGGYDVDPDNKYLKCVDNVIFSKDGKTLFSCPMNLISRDYEIPEGTERIAD